MRKLLLPWSAALVYLATWGPLPASAQITTIPRIEVEPASSSDPYPNYVGLTLPFAYGLFEPQASGVSNRAAAPPFLLTLRSEPHFERPALSPWGELILGFTRVSPVPMLQGTLGLWNTLGRKDGLRVAVQLGTSRLITSSGFDGTVLSRSQVGLLGGYEMRNIVAGSWLLRTWIEVRLIQPFGSDAATWLSTFNGRIGLDASKNDWRTSVSVSVWGFGDATPTNTALGSSIVRQEAYVPKLMIGYMDGRREYRLHADWVIRQSSPNQAAYPYVAPFLIDDYLLASSTFSAEIQWHY